MLNLDHINLPVHDLARSQAFYDAVLAPFGASLVEESGYAVVVGHRNYVVLSLVPEAGEIQTIHLAFRAEARTDVDRFYSIALDAGARDNGEPGLRPHYHAHYYAAFVTDPDGHNLEFVCHENGA